jgi:Protein of unknown function (DUF1569)
MQNIFQATTTNQLIERINKLQATTTPLWGKMSVDQMLAHCNVTYEMVYETKHAKPGAFKKFLLKAFVKNLVVSEKPYAKNIRTAPEFIIADHRNFEAEKQRLINYLQKTVQLGEAHFEGKESHSFGKLSSTEWNNMFYKHLDHHLTQFGV